MHPDYNATIESAVHSIGTDPVIEHSMNIIKKIDDFRVHIAGRRPLTSAHFRSHLLKSLLSSCSSEQSVAFVSSLLLTHKPSDLESIFPELISRIGSIDVEYFGSYAAALLALSKRIKHSKLGILIDAFDSLINSLDVAKGVGLETTREMVGLVRMTLKIDNRLHRELSRRCKSLSVTALLIMVGLSTNCILSAHSQFAISVNVRKQFGIIEQPAIRFESLLEKICNLIDEHDEAGILLLVEQAKMLPSPFKSIVINSLMMKRLACDIVINRWLWPVIEENYKTFHEVNPCFSLLENAKFLIEIDRQDQLSLVLQYMSSESAISLVSSFTINHLSAFSELIKKNHFELTNSIISQTDKISDKTAFLFELILKRVQNKTFADYCINQLFRQAGTENPQEISWLGLCNNFEFHPFFLLAFSLQQNDIDFRTVNCLNILCEFLTCHLEYPNDQSKLTLIVCAFTLCIEYCCCKNSQQQQLSYMIGKLIKKRAILRTKVNINYVDYFLSDETLRKINGMEEVESLLSEQYSTGCRIIEKEQFESSSKTVKKVILNNNHNLALRTIEVDDLELMILELENLRKTNSMKIDDYSFLRIIEMDSSTRLKKIVEIGLLIFPESFLYDLMEDVIEICGKIDDGQNESALSGKKNFKFTIERNVNQILNPIFSFLESKIHDLFQLHKVLRQDASIHLHIDILSSEIIKIANSLSFLCRAALEGNGWDRMLTILISFYQLSINYLRFILKYDQSKLDTHLVLQLSSSLTKVIYLLIPVAHQLDHDKMKTIYEFGKEGGKNGKCKHGNIDGKIAREATRLPRLIYSIETFDFLVVKLSQWHPEIINYIYKSTSRDFRIQVDQIEAALAGGDSSSESTVESGPETN